MSRLSRLSEARSDWRDRKESNTRLAYERRVVRKLITGLGYTKLRRSIDKPSNDDNKWFMTVAWLHDSFPAIPIRLTAHEAEPSRLAEFLKPESRASKLWQGWSSALDCLAGELASGMAIGWIFSFKDDPELGDMIMHTLDMDYMEDGAKHPFTRMHCVYPDGLNVTLEPLKSFISRLKSKWSVDV